VREGEEVKDRVEFELVERAVVARKFSPSFSSIRSSELGLRGIEREFSLVSIIKDVRI